MKKILLLAMLVAAGFAANAQSPFKLGVKAGANFSTLDKIDDKTLVGFNGGLLLQYKFSSHFAIQPEALFTMQGADFDWGMVDLNYLTIPVMLQGYLFPNLCIEAGPQFGFLLSADESKENGDKTNIKDKINSSDIGINVGLAYDFDSFPIGIFGRYTFGLSELEKDGGDNAGANRVFQLGAFIKF